MYQTLGALVLGVVAGLVLSSVAPEEVNSLLDQNVLVPVKTMYMNALKMIVPPVVFFSIVSCIVRFSDLVGMFRTVGNCAGDVVANMVVAQKEHALNMETYNK